jgi:hypothetical protein
MQQVVQMTIRVSPTVKLVAIVETLEFSSRNHLDPDEYERILRARDVGILNLYVKYRIILPCSLAARAIQTSNLSMLKWALMHGYTLNTNSMYIAAAAGNLNMIQWLVDAGCPLHPEMYNSAFVAGHHHVITWLHTQKCPVPRGLYQQAIYYEDHLARTK